MAMPRFFASVLAAASLSIALQSAPARAADTPAGPPMQLDVDATDGDHRVFRVRQRLPVVPGPLKLFFPQWLPGQHAANGEIGRLAGLQIQAKGQALPWRRDPADAFAFLLDVPTGVAELQLAFEYLSPLSADTGRVVMSREMLNLQWQSVLLYAAGTDTRALPVLASLRLPEGWQAASALRPARSEGGWLRFEPVSVDTLIDSPVLAGRHLRRIPLEADGAPRPVALTLVADTAELLTAPSEAQLDAQRKLVQQADRLFGARHFAHYDFLLALSDSLGGEGLEHLQSAEMAASPRFFDGWDKSAFGPELLPHEYVHSWNGKFRRPAGQVQSNFNTPYQNGLLWLYEGQTEFWGKVLAARSGAVAPAVARDSLAALAASLQTRSGRHWRNLQDTTADLQMSGRRQRRDWRDWQRTSADYYTEGVLVWLEADMLIREQSGGTHSLDDFARAFFGVADGQTGPAAYGFDDIVATLNAVWPHDWASFLRERLDGHGPGAPLGGLARAGWQLAWRDTPGEGFKAREVFTKSTDLGYSIGLSVAADGKLGAVNWEGPAYLAGLAPGMVLVAVQQLAFKPERLKAAITANKAGDAPIDLLVRDGDHFRSVRIDWRGGLRYPALERIDGREDRLATLLAPR